MLALPTTQEPRPTGQAASPARAAAEHRWMGKRLVDLPDSELREILRTLEEIAFGERRSPRNLSAGQLVDRIHELDTAMHAVRAGKREQVS